MDRRQCCGMHVPHSIGAGLADVYKDGGHKVG